MVLVSKMKELRQLRGLSQQALAEKLGVKQSTIGGYEAGRSEPNIAMLIRIAKFFDVSIDYLIGADTDAGDNDIELVKKFQVLSERDKLVVDKIMTALNDEKSKQHQQSKNG